ncbi:hypothetical protein J8TS2_34020 [Lederbergia ruris]|uniref:Uncharacterized protein n=1 Tax=Lederbergia ruris TaxID=217495 RepID=A0ABQ4KNV4_9BACI|nr:hypothetical protein J8TS2_34020 [Lederbergia ruris]
MKYVFKKEDKKDPSAKGADVLSATPTLARPVRRKFEAAQKQANELPQDVVISTFDTGRVGT